jgi:hypothetical protein
LCRLGDTAALVGSRRFDPQHWRAAAKPVYPRSMRPSDARTMREAYDATDAGHHPSPSTPMPEREDRRERVLIMRFDGVPLGEQEQALRSDDPGETFYAKALGERNALAHVLVGCGLDRDLVGVTTVAPPATDFRLDYSSGPVFAELARVAGEDRLLIAGSVDAMQKGLAAAMTEDSDLRAIMDGRYVDVRMHLFPATRKGQEAAVGEIIALVKSLDFGSLKELRYYSAPENAAVLKGCDADYVVGVATVGTVRIIVPPTAVPFDEDIVDAINERVADKAKSNYEAYRKASGDAPIWLVLVLADMLMPANWAFGYIAKRIAEVEVGPFDRLVVGCFDGGFIFESDRSAPVRHVRLTGEGEIPRAGESSL